jgi:hypothetical protein
MRMRIGFVLAAIALGVSAPATAAAQMSAGEFLAKAEPLMKKNKAALLFSGEARRLVRLLGDSAQKNRAQLDAARAAGRPVTTCLPPKGKAQINAAELLAHLRALTPAQRAQSFDLAFAGYTAKKYPCRR